MRWIDLQSGDLVVDETTDQRRYWWLLLNKGDLMTHCGSQECEASWLEMGRHVSSYLDSDEIRSPNIQVYRGGERIL